MTLRLWKAVLIRTLSSKRKKKISYKRPLFSFQVINDEHQPRWLRFARLLELGKWRPLIMLEINHASATPE